MPSSSTPAIARHYGLDWLRIGAFALLILYHLSLYFAPGHWIVKSPQEVAWVGWPSAAVVPWRLTLLFAVSGYATAAMIERHPGLGAFLTERSKRLLIPLLFGMLVVIPPQDWVRLEVEGIDRSYLSYLLHDNFAFAAHGATFLPNWEHLWFLPWLWGYTVLLTAALKLLPGWRAQAEATIAWLTDGRRLLYVPTLAILGGTALIEKLHLWTLADCPDHIAAFAFGAAYAHFPRLRQAIRRSAREAVLVSLAALAAFLWLWMEPSADPGTGEELAALAAYSLASWGMLLVMFDLAERFLNRDHKLRQPLAAAVFPAYIVHQTIIVVLGWYLPRWGVTGLPAFLALLGAVIAGCAAAWWLAKTSRFAGTLLGMPHKVRRPPRSCTAGASGTPA